jgi:hypothetical protein
LLFALVGLPLPFLFTPGGSMFVLCVTALVLPVSLVPPIPAFCGPLPVLAPELLFCPPVPALVPIALDAPVDVLPEPPGMLELL